ncbi:response regulator [Krasilnikoviella flava]|uniref:Two component transcriptional regulator, LuxR family n=1 Tax=Krasilnikoviella flava TaxID=526729 RepID=A0A1T5KW52_9MICO|nr:response regulator transcription factor [Krasilnikoviella flava]SKC67937.1 two component transcriptional regulator, LuxR family [Krasilnikoviella flava]
MTGVVSVGADAGAAEAPQRVRLVLADDQTLVRHGIRSLLEIAGGIDVVAEADDGAAAVAAVLEHEPDVLLLDLRMPGRDGIWALETLQANGLDVAVLVLTTFDDDALVLRALQAGARGYLLKDVTLEQLAGAVRTLADGATLVQPAVTARLLRAVRSGPAPADVAPADLTEREREVLRLMAQGWSNREIADALYLAEGTVKNHVSNVLLKLGAKDRTRAVLLALQTGLLA